MDYEKKYNEALEKARQLCAYPTTTPFISDLQDLFPELAESEDEKIRKAIVNAIHNYAYRLEEKIPTEWLTWLEKQGEQKSLNDVAKEITKNKETATSFLKSCGIINTNGELADEYKIEQDEQKPAKWSVEDEACVILLDSICESSEAEYYDHPDSIIRKEIVNARHWLKSIKQRIQKGE